MTPALGLVVEDPAGVDRGRDAEHVLVAGCADQDVEAAGELGDACSPDEEDPCALGLVCAPQGDESGEAYVCAGAIELRGMVVDALDQSPIAGARILALDDTSAPISDVAISDADGHYSLPISVVRDTDGNPLTTVTLTMQASAADYQLYPSGLQPAFPVSTADAEAVEDDPEDSEDDYLKVIENASTTIGMIPLDDAAGSFQISGTVTGDLGAGTLVVAEGSTNYAIADRSGSFTLFNVASGDYELRGYRGGVQISPAAVAVIDADVEGVVLDPVDGSELGSVSGSVNIVNAPGGSATSVVLIPTALFDEVFEFGPVPFGLRAPDPGEAPSVTSAWTIAGVPEGDYTVIASLENDLLVRDPDTSIAGTQILELSVGAGEDVELQDSFKVTEALAVVSPGRDEPEEVSGTPTFVFADDSSEDGYVVVVHDALGTEIWFDDTIDGVSGSSEVEVEYTGPALTRGMYYRFQATSMKDGVPLSRTEDLRGVFVYAGE
ncbi:hypothetical protein G6O69_22090 [Pseudenhygromyxa sp. WMMC2535]|uniref:carboxypeptidase-like regulatory domain-containing protein n=1 Tax=Pseudenhygromyxa sp. WMMC2535 TaxID=2712867 RepID=UPI0015955992|nr:carboxypeptidase-like regulatory domain-containing protein [Pseudenhygromyxa sp. WMMC2535]NVB40548.1 hypothetical protein [Pseudenhygromyxa sp. WMMC2535]